MSDDRIVRGYAGEQHFGFYLGSRGFFFVEGPGGSGGHGVTQSGFDGVAYSPTHQQLLLYDNKSFARIGNVGSATAIDPERNLLQNINKLIPRVQQMTDLPDQQHILDLLMRTRNSLATGAPWPQDVKIAVSNAGGRSTGISARLARAGIEFIDFNHAPSLPKGSPTPLEVTRSLLPRGPQTVAAPELPGRLRAAATSAGAGIGTAGLSLLLGFLRGQFDQSVIDNQIKAAEPDIKARIYALRKERDHVQRSGRTPFAIIEFEIMVTVSSEEDHSVHADLPVCTLKNVTISATPVKAEARPEPYRFYFGYQQRPTTLRWSTPVPLGVNEVP